MEIFLASFREKFFSEVSKCEKFHRLNETRYPSNKSHWNILTEKFVCFSSFTFNFVLSLAKGITSTVSRHMLPSILLVDPKVIMNMKIASY